jgi:predicted phosphoribosyltransferase
MDTQFADRRAAGRALAGMLAGYRDVPGLLVLALPRGGVPVAWEVARALDAELDVLVVRKLGVPGHPELAMGAIASGGGRVLNDEVIRAQGVEPPALAAVLRAERDELARRERAYRGDRPPPAIRGRAVILVDDGLATGASMRVAVAAVRSLAPRHIAVAVPVAPADAARELASLADAWVCALTPARFRAVGEFYADFAATTDAEVEHLLAAAARRGAA